MQCVNTHPAEAPHVNAADEMLGRMVRELQEAGHGDAGRLAHVADTVARGRPVYRSDRQYVELKHAELGRRAARLDPARAGRPVGPGRADAAGRVGPETPVEDARARILDEGAARQAGRGYGGGEDMRAYRADDGPGPQSRAGSSPPYAAPQGRGAGAHDRGQEHAARAGAGSGPTVQPRASAAWYLLPIFMSIVGGIISYAALRHRDPSRARRSLVIGAVLFALPVAAFVAFAVYGPDAMMYGTDRESTAYGGMEDGEIKAAAIEVPYASLESNPDAYAGTIIRYEGHVIQAEKDPFWDSYVLRIGTSTDGMGLPEEDIWSEYRPRSGAEERWLDGLDREGLIAQGEDSGVAAWGEVVGSQEYDTLFGGKRSIPAVDVLILERAG